MFASEESLAVSRLDAEGLEAVYLALMDLGPKVVQVLHSSIEEVRFSKIAVSRSHQP